MAFNVISTTNGKEITSGVYSALIYGVADLGSQPGFNPGDAPQDKFAAGLRIIDNDNTVREWWEVYGYKFIEKSNLKMHLGAGGLITPADLTAGLKPPNLIGRTTNAIFGTGTRADGSEKSKLLGMSPLKTPLDGVTLAALKAGGSIVYDRSNHDEALFQRLPPWIRAKTAPNQTTTYSLPVAPVSIQSPTSAVVPAFVPFFAGALDTPAVTPAAPATAPANSALDAW